MAHPLRTSIEDFIHALQSFEQDAITQDKVRALMEQMPISQEAIRPYTFWRDAYYTRNLIYKDPLFEVMAICWAPGQKTAIHSHNGQLGWMTTLQGEVDVHNFRYLRCNHPEFQNVVGMDCLGGATQIELEQIGSVHCSDDKQVYLVDKLQTIHQIDNSDPTRAGCVTLHVYSLPFESCVTFDMEHQRCGRRDLSYYSRYGKLEAPEQDHDHAPTPYLVREIH
jgi:cysteine dioxygenase